MNHIIIRTCLRDDYIASLCYESFKLAGIEGDYSFLVEVDSDNLTFDDGRKVATDINDYKWIHKDDVNIHTRPYCGNYGGQSGARHFVYSLRNYNFDDDDIVIIADSDVVVKSNFLDVLPEDFDHAGLGEHITKGQQAGYMLTKIDNFLHVSGQMQIYKGKTIRKILGVTEHEEVIDKIIYEMAENGLNVADDTFASYITDKLQCKKVSVDSYGTIKKFWIHREFYDYTGRDDWENIINEITD